MPIYEYQAVGDGCDYCRHRFEVRQSISEPPLSQCPQCGAPVRRLFPRPYLSLTEELSKKEKLVKHTPEEADKLGLVEGFAEDRIYE